MSQSQRKIKVCCFCERWETGGIEAFLYNILTHMNLSNLEVDIVVFHLDNGVFTDHLKSYGINFYQLSGKLRSPKNGRAFWNLLKKRNYDVVYLNVFQGLSFYYGYLAQKANVPIRIAHSHGTGLRNTPGKKLKMGLHQLGKTLWSSSITDFWACSHCAAEFLFSKGQAYQWIPDGIETERFRFQLTDRMNIRNELGAEENCFLIGTVGRLSEEKNHRFLLKIFYEIKKKRKNSILLIVGTGPLKERLRRQAEKLGLEKDVIFYGASSQVERLLWAIDVFVFPSDTEGFGIAGVEAQAAGLPVICSEAIPPEAMITDQTVQLKLSTGAKAWAEKIMNTDIANRESGVEAVSSAGFDIQTVAEQIRARWMRDKIER